MPTQQRYGEPVVTLRMPKPLYDAIKRLAIREGSSVSNVIREAAESYTAAQE